MNMKRVFDTRREEMSKEKNSGGDARGGVARRSSRQTGKAGDLLRTRAVSLPYGFAFAVLRVAVLLVGGM